MSNENDDMRSLQYREDELLKIYGHRVSGAL